MSPDLKNIRIGIVDRGKPRHAGSRLRRRGVVVGSGVGHVAVVDGVLGSTVVIGCAAPFQRLRRDELPMGGDIGGVPVYADLAETAIGFRRSNCSGR